jgi:hypothetical protein
MDITGGYGPLFCRKKAQLASGKTLKMCKALKMRKVRRLSRPSSEMR